MHIVKHIPLMYLLLMLLYPLNLQAIQVRDLYQAAVPVADQSPASRVTALREILRKVLIKVSGQSTLSAARIKQFGSIEHMVEQFGYETRQSTPTGKRRLYLWAKLSPMGVKNLVRQAQLPIWPEERPETLLWIAVQDLTGTQVLSEGSSHVVMKYLQQVAGDRGLPVVLPLMDLQESSVVSFDTVVAMQADALQPPSARYASQYVLMGSIQQIEADMWRGRWRLLGDNEEVTVTPAGPLRDTIDAGINPLASRIARQFASYSYIDGEQYIDLAVDDINGAEDYARSLKYLQSLSLVTGVDVAGVDGPRVNYRLHTRADLASVLQGIDLGKVLYARENSIDQLVFGLYP